MKNKVFAVLGGFVSLFGLGYVIYVLLFENSDMHFGLGTDVMRPETNFGAIIAMEILYALFLTHILGKYAQIKTFGAGLKAGFVIGFFIGLCFILYIYGVSTMTSLNGIVFYALTFAVRFAIAGGVIGYLLGKSN